MHRAPRSTSHPSPAPRPFARTVVALLLVVVGASAAIAQGDAAEAANLTLDLRGYEVTMQLPEGGVHEAAEGDDASMVSSVEVLVPALEVQPGTRLVWYLAAHHDAPEALQDVVLDLPVPAGTAYVPGSARLRLRARGDDPTALVPSLTEVGVPTYTVLASLSGQEPFLPVPLLSRVEREIDGEMREVEEPVAGAEYAAIRVRIDELPAGTTAVFVVETIVR